MGMSLLVHDTHIVVDEDAGGSLVVRTVCNVSGVRRPSLDLGEQGVVLAQRVRQQSHDQQNQSGCRQHCYCQSTESNDEEVVGGDTWTGCGTHSDSDR